MTTPKSTYIPGQGGIPFEPSRRASKGARRQRDREARGLARTLICRVHESPVTNHRSRILGGAGRDRTADKGFADLCLTTWRPRPNLDAGSQNAVIPRQVHRRGISSSFIPDRREILRFAQNDTVRDFFSRQQMNEAFYQIRLPFGCFGLCREKIEGSDASLPSGLLI